MIRFIMGAITGALVIWFWREDIRHYLDQKTRSVRARAADGLKAVEDTAGSMMDRAKAPLQRAEELLDEGKAQVASNLRAAQEAIRPGSNSP